ncbi:tetratricopeptide repeat protein [Frankia sp. CcWB3]
MALATERLTRAREIFADFGDELGEARTLRGLADACRGRGEFSTALVHFEAGLEMMRRAGARKAEAETLVNVAMVHGDRNELTDGINCLTMSLSIARELGNRPLEALALRRLGDLHRFQHRLDRALASYNESLPLLAELPDTRWEPRVLIRRGDILAQMDDHPAARRSWQQGITLLRQRGSPELPAAEERLSAPVTAEPTQFTSGRLLSTFDPAYFIARIASSRRSVRLLNTWTDLATPEHRTAFADAVLAAVDAGAIIQVLLLDPDSPAVAGRAADLLRSVDVPGMIHSNLLVLEALRDRLAPVLRPRLAVRLYTEQPLTTYHRWGTGALVSTFPVGYSSAAATQHEAAISSTLVQFVEQHFERLWSLEGSTALDDYLRVPLRVFPSDAAHLEVQAEFVRLDGAVYVSSPDLVALLGRGGPDGLLAEVAGDGRHVLAGTGRCRVVPLRDNDGAGAVATAFADKYGAVRDSLLRLSSVRR